MSQSLLLLSSNQFYLFGFHNSFGYTYLLPEVSQWVIGLGLDCKTVGLFLKISKEIGKAWRKSLMRAKRASLTRP